jgi:hypothetical protein
MCQFTTWYMSACDGLAAIHRNNTGKSSSNLKEVTRKQVQSVQLQCSQMTYYWKKTRYNAQLSISKSGCPNHNWATTHTGTPHAFTGQTILEYWRKITQILLFLNYLSTIILANTASKTTIKSRIPAFYGYKEGPSRINSHSNVAPSNKFSQEVVDDTYSKIPKYVLTIVMPGMPNFLFLFSVELDQKRI